MAQNVTITLRGTVPGCPPLSCYQQNDEIFFQLATGSVGKSADGSGWLLGFLLEDAQAVCEVGVSDWVFTIVFPDSEITPGETVTANDLATGENDTGLCCPNCGDLAVLAKLLARDQAKNIFRESFRIFDYDEPHAAELQRLFRMGRDIEISGIDASVEEHLTGYPYAENPLPVTLSFHSTTPQNTGPYSVFDPGNIIIDPASNTPLTGSLDWSASPRPLKAGAGFAVIPSSIVPESHLGLEVHINFKVTS